MTQLNEVVVDVRAVEVPQALHQALKQALALPEHTGPNFDALWDSVSDRGLPRQLVLQGGLRLLEVLPRETRLLAEVVDDYTAAHLSQPCVLVLR